MNKIECSCGNSVYYNASTIQRKIQFKVQHTHHLIGKFKIYPSELLQIAFHMTTENEESNS